MGDLIQWLTDRTGASIVVQEGLDDRRVAMEIHGQSLMEVLDVTAARLGVTLDRRGRLFYLGASRPDSRGVLVRRVRRLSMEELSQAVQAHVSSDGRLAVFEDGLLVVCDKVQVLERIVDIINQVEAADSPVWCVQLHLLALSDTDSRELGLESTPSLDLAAAFATGTGVGITAKSVMASAGLQTALKVAAARGASSVLGQPCFLLADGQEATFAAYSSGAGVAESI